MVLLNANQNDKEVNFSGIKHRLFIEGRGFDFRLFRILNDGSAIVEDHDDGRIFYLNKIITLHNKWCSSIPPPGGQHTL